MLTAYGFVTIKNFINNTPGKLSVVGELSSIGYTFSTEVGSYSLSTYPDVTLKTFSVERDGTEVSLDLTYYTTILNISQWLYNRSIQGLITSDATALLQALNSEFATVATFASVGEIINNGSYNFPASLQVEFDTAGEDNTLYIWYADANFQAEYPNKEFTVVMPFDDIDGMLTDPTTTLSTINSITVAGHTKRIESARNGNPETSIWTGNFTWVSVDNDEITAEMPISVLIYGAAGNNIDYIKEAIRDYITSNSTITTTTGQTILPDLFIPTEFYLIPIWDRISLPNQLETTALYSPVIPMRLIYDYTDKYMVDYPQTHVAANVVVASSTYQNIIFLACGHPDNYGVSYQFDVLWPKYAAITTTSTDFGKIPEETRNFIIDMIALFKVAETATDSSILPTGYTRTERGGYYYITYTYETVQYLVPIKTGFVIGTSTDGNS